MDKLVNFLGNLHTWFNDFIGAIAPAAVFVSGIWMIPDIRLPIVSAAAAWGDYVWLPAIGGLFLMGHLLLGISSLLRDALSRWFGSWERPQKAVSQPLRRVRALLNSVLPLPQLELAPENVRNIAMTMSPTGEELGRRFVFLAQFCFGSGAALLLIGLAWLIRGFAVISAPATPAVEEVSYVMTAVILASCVFGWIVLTRRGIQFRNQAFGLPFDAVLADVAAHKLGLPQSAGTAAALVPATASTASDPVTPGAPAPDVLPI